MSMEAVLREDPDAGEEELREALAGNLCRCTGYLGIVEAVHQAAREMREGDDGRD
jgi:aerobic-type carbon monoxide dehydrogenase small subunit (CoxS/CutS family)